MMNKKKYFRKKPKKINFLLGAGAVTFIVILFIIATQRKDNTKTQHEQFSNQPTIPPTKLSESKIFSIENIPNQREDINSQLTLEQRKKGQKLSPTEEKTIIESLASQVDIDKEKSFFDYKGGFGMVPGVREFFEDCDQAFYLFTDKGKFFVKINNYSDLSRFEYEKESMETINEVVPDFAPRPLCLGNLPKGGKFLVVNFIEARGHDRLIIENQKLLAKSLVQLHQKKSPNGKFGFHVGRNNQGKNSWEKFFLENRWRPLGKRVREKYPQDEELRKGGETIEKKVIPDLLGNLSAEPVLIHGNLDFDSGDISSQTNQPGVFDAHSYYGHNEMDLSLIHYYGPPGKEKCEGEFFEPEFLAEYIKHCSLPPGFEKRRDLYRLYDYLHRRIANFGHPDKKFREKSLARIKKLGQS